MSSNMHCQEIFYSNLCFYGYSSIWTSFITMLKYFRTYFVPHFCHWNFMTETKTNSVPWAPRCLRKSPRIWRFVTAGHAKQPSRQRVTFSIQINYYLFPIKLFLISWSQYTRRFWTLGLNVNGLQLLVV